MIIREVKKLEVDEYRDNESGVKIIREVKRFVYDVYRDNETEIKIIVIRELKRFVYDVYRDIELMNNNSRHAYINSIVIVDNDYIARFGSVSYTLDASRDIDEILYMLMRLKL